jgi:hypothetical protein
MDLRRKRILSGLAEAAIILASIFLLADAVLGFTRPEDVRAVQAQPVSQYIDSADLSASCAGGYSNQRMTGGSTQVASRGTPFNAYQLTLTNIGMTAFTIYSMDVELLSSGGRVFAQHRTDFGNGAGITLQPGETREIVEAYGINHPVASCDVLSWQS